MKKIAIVVSIVIIILLATIFEREKDHSGDVVKIGVSLPLSGGAAFLGESARDAALMALEDAGDTRYTYNLVIEDDGFDPTKTATIANKFISVDKVLGMITFGSGTGNAASPIAEVNKTAHFSLASDPTVANGEFNFIHWSPAYIQGELLAEEIVKREYTTVSIINNNHSGTTAVSQAVEKGLKENGVEILSYTDVAVGTTDFRTILNQVKNENPDIVVLELFSPDIEIAYKQMKELEINIPVTSVETFEWSATPELFNGMWFVTYTSVPDSFADRYKEKYGKAHLPGAAYVYDLVTLMIKEQESADDILTSEELRNRIVNRGYYESTVFGKIEIDTDGIFMSGADVKKIVDGVAVPIEE